MWKLCHCSRRTLNVHDAIWVFGSRPRCGEHCYIMALARHRRVELQRRLECARIPLASPDDANLAAG
jgi:hypothetical protein